MIFGYGQVYKQRQWMESSSSNPAHTLKDLPRTLYTENVHRTEKKRDRLRSLAQTYSTSITFTGSTAATSCEAFVSSTAGTCFVSAASKVVCGICGLMTAICLILSRMGVG